MVQDDRLHPQEAERERGGRERTIAHLDLDAFFVSVELLRRPELVGKPVIVAGSGPRSVVTTASYEARRFGVGSAMPAAKALRLCPEAVVVPPDGAEYRRASSAVMEILHHHVSVVEQAGLDEAYVDLTGMAAPTAAMRRVVVDIERDTGLHASVGLGPNRLVAKVASDADKPRGFLALTTTQARLRFAGERCGLIPGVGPKTEERLRRLGITTIADMGEAPIELLVEHFGTRHGPWLHDRARFEDDTPVQPRREAVSESRESTFDVDIEDRAELERRLDMLAGELGAALKLHGHHGRTVAIKIRYADFETHTRAKTITEPTADPVAIASVARALLREFDPNRPVRLLGVRVAGFERGREASGQLALPLA
ncbi:MAG: DNA polymerase IV [Actinomycetes bacterium]